QPPAQVPVPVSPALLLAQAPAPAQVVVALCAPPTSPALTAAAVAPAAGGYVPVPSTPVSIQQTAAIIQNPAITGGKNVYLQTAARQSQSWSAWSWHLRHFRRRHCFYCQR